MHHHAVDPLNQMTSIDPSQAPSGTHLASTYHHPYVTRFPFCFLHSPFLRASLDVSPPAIGSRYWDCSRTPVHCSPSPHIMTPYHLSYEGRGAHSQLHIVPQATPADNGKEATYLLRPYTAAIQLITHHDPHGLYFFTLNVRGMHTAGSAMRFMHMLSASKHR